MDATYKTHAVCRLCEANSDGDNLILDGIRLPLLRQQIIKKSGDPYLCLSDFVRPASSGITDTVGVFATTVDAAMEHLYEDDPFKRMLVQTLADRLAEATAEYFHEQVRKTIWGYAPDENLSMKDLLIENYQGIRPAIGYPSLPDQSINFILDKLLDFSSVGIKLTEHGAMLPHASVSGLMISHPQSHYFAIGKIDEYQLADYAERKGCTLEEAKKYLRQLLVD